MKQLNFFIKTITTSSSYLSRTFFLSVFLLIATLSQAATHTYDFSNVTDTANWTITKANSNNVVSIQTETYGEMPIKDGGMLSFYSKGGSGTIKVETKTSFTNVTKLSFDFIRDSDNPTFTIKIGETTIASAINPKTADKTTAENKEWGACEYTLNNLTGKLIIEVGTTSTNKYAAIDNIVITTADGSSTYTLTYNSNIPNPWNVTDLPYAIASMPADESDITTTTISTTTPTLNDNDYPIYTFKNWNTNPDGAGTSYSAGTSITLEANTTLYAQWQACAMDIKYYDSDKTTELTGLTPESYTYDTETSLPTPTKTDSTFVAWHNTLNNAEVTSTQKYWGVLSVYAQWQKSTTTTYTVTYNANGGTCTTSSATYTGTALTLPTPTYDDYTFNGWYTAQTGGTLVGQAGDTYTPTENITLYAQWTENTPSSCETSVYYQSVPDGKTNTNRFTFDSTPSGTKSLQETTMVIDGVTYTATKRSNAYKKGFSFTVEEGKEATLYLCIKGGGNDRVVHLTQGTTDKTVTINNEANEDKSYKTFTVSNLTSGTWNFTCCNSDGLSGQSFYIAMLGLLECTTLPDCATPVITTHPQGATYCGATSIAALTIEASVSDEGTLSYQWYKDGTAITDATSNTYTPTESGTYTVVVTNSLADHNSASTTSSEAVISINTLPTEVSISGDAATLAVGETMKLTASSDATDITYQWYKNGEAVEGQTGNTYSFTASSTDLQQTFEICCKVKGCDNNEIQSSTVSFTVVYSECNYITENKTLSPDTGYDFGNQVLYIQNEKYTTSTSNVCSPATYRYYTNTVIVEVKNHPLGAIRLQGQQAYDVNIASVSVASALNGTYTELSVYTPINYTTGDCGELGITGVYIPAGKFVKLIFSSSSKNEFRISGLCVDGPDCSDELPRISPETYDLQCNQTITLNLVDAAGNTYTTGDVQWYKDGSPIDGATSYTYQCSAAGTYTATRTLNCTQWTTNSAVVTSAAGTPTVNRLANNQFYQIANRTLRPYTADMHYSLFLVGYKGQTTDNKTYQTSATIHKQDGQVLPAQTAIDWVRQDAEAGNDSVILGADYTKLGTWIQAEQSATGISLGDTIFLTVAPANGCNEIDTNIHDSIPVILTDKYSLGYIVTGTVKGGIFQTDAANLTDELYTGLQTEYNVTALNAYANYDYTNYEPYDILLLTDYPNTEDAKTQINDLADLVDKKPILSLKAHMASLSKWKTKGFNVEPVVPGDGNKENAPKTLTVLCFAHEMFNGAEWDNETDRTISILDSVAPEGKKYKGIQGFEATATADLMNIAIVYDSKGDRNLVACCERQNVIEARFVMLSVNRASTKCINAKGTKMIDLFLTYLLETDKNRVSDCALTFDNGGADSRTGSGDGKWGNAANWSSNSVPTALHNVRIEADCNVTDQVFEVANVRINQNYHLTIQPSAGLASTGQFAVYPAGQPTEPVAITDPQYVTVQADANNSGMLIYANDEPIAATVQMYSPAYYKGTNAAGKPVRYWSYVGIPTQTADIPQHFRGAYTYVWKESSGWERRKDGSSVDKFDGIGLSQPAGMIFSFAGTLIAPAKTTLTLTNTADGYQGLNMIGNSWTAPIQITRLKTSDFGEGLEPTIYLYNTGRDPESGATSSSSDFTTAGQWMAIPVNSAKQSGWAGPTVIPAMQTFEVNFAEGATQTSATLTLDYDSVVRATSYGSSSTHKLYMPKRTTDTAGTNPAEPLMLRLSLQTDTKRADLHLLQADTFQTTFDAGWDAWYHAGDDRAIGIYALTEIGDMAVSAQPSLAGTTVAASVKPDEDYLLTFTYSGGAGNYPALYLNDMQLRQSTLIDNTTYYAFRSAEGDMQNRFVIADQPFNADVTTNLASIVNQQGNYILNNPAAEQITVAIYDAAGRLCDISSSNKEWLQLNIPMAQGVYMVHLYGAASQRVVKIIR